MDQAHKARLAELEAKETLDENETAELAALKEHEAQTEAKAEVKKPEVKKPQPSKKVETKKKS